MKHILECFEYNQHFVAMMNIINYARLTNKNGNFQKHHIVPRCWFKKHNLPVDNTENNLVNLTVEQHRKVHILASLCATTIMKASLKYAAIAMNRGDMFCSHNPFYGCKHDDSYKHKMSVLQKNRIHTEEEIKKMSLSKKGKPSHNKGKPMSEEQKQKIRDYWKTHIRIPWNKGKRMVK